jgi:hypothetical protein
VLLKNVFTLFREEKHFPGSVMVMGVVIIIWSNVNTSLQDSQIPVFNMIYICLSPWDTVKLLSFYIRQFRGQPFCTQERVGLNSFIKFNGRKATVIVISWKREGVNMFSAHTGWVKANLSFG